MKIISTQYTLQYKSLDIYVAGCNGNPHCDQCHNPESWNFNQGTQYDKNYYKDISNKIKEFDLLIDNIMLFGGEPLDQNIDELIYILLDLKQFNKKLWLFTRYTLLEIPKEILRLCDYIKCGKYIPTLKVEKNIQYGINLATSNQKIYKKGLDYET
jgi:anaerobic ribonucleoside-triphosphate reductase activating protein